MSLHLTRRFRHSMTVTGLFAGLLALVVLLASGAVVADDQRSAEVAALEAASVFCAPGTADAPSHAPLHRHADDLTLCDLVGALAAPALMPASGPPLPMPVLMLALRDARVPPARAPPSVAIVAAYPRGPPVSV